MMYLRFYQFSYPPLRNTLHNLSLIKTAPVFSALNMRSVREKAREVGLEESIKLLIGISPSETSTQLQYCLDQMCNPASEADPSLGDSEDEEDEVHPFSCLPLYIFSH